MIIGIDASRANRTHKSGTEWYSYYLIKELSRLDSANQYVLYTDAPLAADLLDLTGGKTGADEAARGSEQKIKSSHGNFRAKILRWPFKYLWTQGRLSLEMLFSPPDALFVPSHTLPFIHPRRSIITIHDVGFERDRGLYRQGSMGPSGKQRRRFLNFLVRLFTRGKYGANLLDYYSWSTIFGLKQAAKIITVSNFSKDEIIEIYQKEMPVKTDLQSKIEVIYNGFNEQFCNFAADTPATRSVLAKYGIEEPYIFYVGRLERKKNIANLIEAFALLLERNGGIRHKLILAGDASFGYDEIKYMVNHYNLEGKVVKTGWVDEGDLPHIYRRATAFIFPSLYEGFGIPLLQAMACGVPVACSNAASIPEVAGEAALYFDPHNPQEMSVAIEKIVTDAALRQDLAEKGLRRAASFGWKQAAQRTLEAISSTGRKTADEKNG